MSIANRPVYNSRNPEMTFPLSRMRWTLCALLLFVVHVLLFSQISHASDWRASESELSAKIAAVTGPGVIAFQFNNRSSINVSDAEQIHRDLLTLLAASGMRVGEPDQAASTVFVTLSENLQNYVWIAEIRQGTSEPSVVMVSTPRADSPAPVPNAPPLNLRATPLISQPEPILDVAVIAGNPRRLLALSGSAITPYEFRDSRWVSGQPLAIVHDHDHPLPRDPRGRLVLRKTGDLAFDTYLPGMGCRSVNSATLAVNCSASDDPWPLQTPDSSVSAFYAPARNFFTGALVPGIGQQKSAPAFYSAAAIPRVNYVLWIFAGVDGQLHMIDSFNHQTAPRIHWGSDIAGVHAACRTDWQVLATSNGIGSDKDSIQAFEFADREPVPASQKLELNGNVTALWSAQDGQSAIAVFRNSETGNYEALQLDLICGK